MSNVSVDAEWGGRLKEEDVHSFVTVLSGWLPFAVSECAYYVGHPCLATRSTWCILRLKMARDGCAAGLMPFGWCQLVELAPWSGSQTHCFEYKVTLHQGAQSETGEFFIAPNIVSSSLAGWLCLRIRGCGWLVILILFMACDICHRPIPMLCVWFEPSSMIANGIQDSAIPPNGCSRLKTRKSFIFVRSWAGQHHPSQIQVHRGENIGEQRNIATSTSGQPKRAVGPLTQGAVGVGG